MNKNLCGLFQIFSTLQAIYEKGALVLVVLDAEWSEVTSPCKYISNLGTGPGHNFKGIFLLLLFL